MIQKAIFLVLSFAVTSYAFANDDNCDKCNKAASAAFLVCLKDAKTESAKKECDAKKEKQQKVCNFSVCLKKPF